MRRLSELEGGRVDDAPVARDVSSIDPGSIVQTVLIGSAVGTFVATASKNLADDGYAGVKRWLKDLVQRNRQASADPEQGRNVLMIIENPDSKPDVSLNLWLEAPPTPFQR